MSTKQKPTPQFVASTLKKENINYQRKVVLVTGGAGFLGSFTCEVLLDQKANVICIDNFSTGLKSNIAHLLEKSNFSLIEHDISKPIYIDRELDVVIHMASSASPFDFKHHPIQIMKANTLGTWIALGLAKEHGAKLLYASSSEVYGDPEPEFIPTLETYNGNVNPVGPRACYDEAKRTGEAFVKAYQMQHNMDTRIIRIFNTYGPRLREGELYGRVVSNFIHQCLNNKPLTVFGDGSQTRSFVYLSDMVEGILRAAFLPKARGEVINLGGNKEIPILNLAKTIKRLTKSSSTIEFHPPLEDDPKRRRPSISKARKLLKWRPHVSLRDGLKWTLIWTKMQQMKENKS